MFGIFLNYFVNICFSHYIQCLLHLPPPPKRKQVASGGELHGLEESAVSGVTNPVQIAGLFVSSDWP